MAGIEQNATEQNAKRNLDPPLRALQSARASSVAFAIRLGTSFSEALCLIVKNEIHKK